MAIADAPALYAALAGDEVGRYLGGPDLASADDARARIERVLQGPATAGESWLNYTVRLRDGTVIGRVEATVREATLPEAMAEVAWVLGEPWWGQGYGLESARWLVDRLAEERGPIEIWATVHPDNAASRAIMARLGMVEQSPPYEHELGSWDPGDLVYAYAPARSARNGLAG